MKAIIMAGGEGRRLRAVTGDSPKPMVSFLGRPMMEHIIMLLKEQGFDDVCVTLRYRSQDIIDYFGDGKAFGVKIQYRIEDKPLGTAGSVKNCRDFYGSDDFLVISGDAACDFQLGKLMKAHKDSGACASLALYRSSNPVSYGLAIKNEDSSLRCFVEKPSWSRVVTDLVNTGIYVLSPKAMDYVPDNTAYDFGKELFPLLLKKGEKLMGFELDGYWCDVGSPLSYYRCCVDALEGRLKLKPSDEFRELCSAEDLEPEAEGVFFDCKCKNRAKLMAALSDIVLDMDPDYSDGIRISNGRYRLHIAPLSKRSAVRLSVQSADTEFARSLAFTTKELIEALDL